MCVSFNQGLGVMVEVYVRFTLSVTCRNLFAGIGFQRDGRLALGWEWWRMWKHEAL